MTSVAPTPDPFKDIRDYGATIGFNPNAQGKYEVGDDNTAYRLYSHFASKGYKGADLDTAYGWASGTADNTAKRLGLSVLGGGSPANAPAPAPSPTPTPAGPPAIAGAGAAPGTSIMERAMSGATSAVGAPPPMAPAPPPYQGVASRSGQAAQTKLDESKLAAGRAAAIMREGSPLMDVARLRGNQGAAARGMLGSSMAVEAAQKAMIEAATPLAQTDASIYGQAQMANTAQANQWDLTDAQLQQSDRQFGAKLGSDESQFSRSLAENARQANLGASTQLSIAGMNYDIQDRRLSQEDQQFLKSFELESKKLDTAIAQFEKQYGLDVNKLSQQDRQYYDGLKLERDKLNQQADQFNRDWENKFSLENMAAQNRIDLANIDAANKKDLMGIEAAYKTDIASNETISNGWGSMMQEIGRIQNNPDIEAGAKATMISNVIGQFGAFANFWKKISGGDVDVSDLLNMKIANAPADAGGGTNSGGGGNSTAGGGNGGNGGDGTAEGTAGGEGNGSGSSSPGAGNNADGDAAGIGIGPL